MIRSTCVVVVLALLVLAAPSRATAVPALPQACVLLPLADPPSAAVPWRVTPGAAPNIRALSITEHIATEDGGGVWFTYRLCATGPRLARHTLRLDCAVVTAAAPGTAPDVVGLAWYPLSDNREVACIAMLRPQP